MVRSPLLSRAPSITSYSQDTESPLQLLNFSNSDRQIEDDEGDVDLMRNLTIVSLDAINSEKISMGKGTW